jgi:hypothetical protein
MHDAMTLEDVFSRQCAALDALTPADVPNLRAPYVVIHEERPIGWFETFAEASAFGRTRYAPETYAIGNPAAAPDYLPMFIVKHPMA